MKKGVTERVFLKFVLIRDSNSIFFSGKNQRDRSLGDAIKLKAQWRLVAIGGQVFSLSL